MLQKLLRVADLEASLFYAPMRALISGWRVVGMDERHKYLALLQLDLFNYLQEQYVLSEHKNGAEFTYAGLHAGLVGAIETGFNNLKMNWPRSLQRRM